MKKLLLVSAALFVVLSLASCKKTLQPSAIEGEDCPTRVYVYGMVNFEAGSNTVPGIGDWTVVTFTNKKTKATTSAIPNGAGQYRVAIPLEYGTVTASFSVKATVNQPFLGKFEGTASEVSFSNIKAKNESEVSTITCTEVKD